jgi:hypothetical protein
MKDEARLTIRLPGNLRQWLEHVKEEQGSSINYEIIRSIRDRMDRSASEESTRKASSTNLTATAAN